MRNYERPTDWKLEAKLVIVILAALFVINSILEVLL